MMNSKRTDTHETVNDSIARATPRAATAREDGKPAASEERRAPSRVVRSRPPRTRVVVASDLPTLTGILPWERVLLLPIVDRLLDDVLAEVRDESPPAADK
jgi:hypothetical protein